MDKKTILLIDDNALNRKILSKILVEDYEIIEAENGEIALKLLGKYGNRIAGIMLDLVMPQMDGFEFLSIVTQNVSYKNIPIIVSTGNTDEENEVKALEAGAWDFVSKPYKAKLIKFRLKNVIARSQLAIYEQLRYMAEYDVLTGIYNKDKFYEQTEKMLIDNSEKSFVFVSFDIDRFQLINSFYGMKEGDNLLKYLAKILQNYSLKKEYMTYGRMEADIFAFCILNEGKAKLKQALKHMERNIKAYNLNFDIVSTYGIYEIDNNWMSANLMYDRARLAAKLVKGNYIHNSAYYTDDIGKALEEEQRITNEMNTALEQEQFIVYLQPKYSVGENRLVGAEALVRWKHPGKGMISPGIFIPVFERNGFITKLDYYMWEKVCVLLCSWMDKGMMPHPVSVNVSRVNLYNPNLVKVICKLADKYRIPRELLQLELTESAYTDNPGAMKEIMKSFHDEGFTVLMDDFGSGYSSLNVLKDIPVDVLKIDMKFFDKADIPGRGENIVASVVRMAKWLHIPTIAEGVETKEQVDFLRSIGCECVQGYYYAKPMNVEDFEDLAKNNAIFHRQQGDAGSADDVSIVNQQMESMLANAMQPLTVYEFDGKESIELIRVNNAFYEMFGWEDEVLHCDSPLEVAQEEYWPEVLKAFQKAVHTREMAECEYVRKLADGSHMWIHLKLKYISQIGMKSVLIGSLFDISNQKKVELELNHYRSALEKQNQQFGKVLLVDDEEVNRVVLEAILEDEYESLHAQNGMQALQILQEYQGGVDMIFLDLSMPVMNGMEFLKKKNQIDAFRDIPVIIITADETSQNQIDAINLGASDYVLKPFVRETVIRRMRNVLESRKSVQKVMNNL